jgi:hypothetical protein
MRYFLLIFVSIFFFSAGHSQEIELRKDSKSKYIKNSERVVDQSNGSMVYSILRMELGDEREGLKLSVDKGTGEIPNKYAERVFPELEKLVKSKFSSRSEVDLLNYLSAEGWEIFAVETTAERKISYRKFYIRKRIESRR